MRLFVFILLFSLSSNAYYCPTYIDSNSEAAKAHQWLNEYKGVTELHGCNVEITVCEKSDKINNTAPIGEILIQTPDGREAYLFLDFPDENTPELHTKVKTSKRAFHFYKKDRFYEEENGRTEVWRFEIRTLWEDPKILNVLELGVYTTNSNLNQSNGNESHWFVCAP